MTKRFNDPRALEIDPQQVADYLLSRGWKLQEQIGEKAMVWDRPGDQAEIWLPLRRQLSDYGRLMDETIQVLQDVEQRSIDAIFQDMSLQWADITRFRIDTGMFGTPTMPLGDGVVAIQATRDVISYGARQEQKAAYHSRPTGQMSRFLNELRLGQTEVGSYIITVISPLTVESPHYARSAMLQVWDSVHAARDAASAARQTSDIGRFDAAVERGVSANLCDALVVLGESSPDSAVEMQVTWSNQIQSDRPILQSVTLDAAIIGTLRAGAEHLRDVEPVREIQVRGLVQDLSDRSEQDRVSQIVMIADIGGKMRRVRFSVQGADRRSAIEAFDSRLPIAAFGTLDLRKTPYALTDVQWIKQIDENGELVPRG